MKKDKIDISLKTQTSNTDNTCPKCKKGKMVVNVMIRRKLGFIPKFINTYTSFCPSCGHTIKKEI